MYADLKDKVVLITGAAGALGSSVVRYFQNAGSNLVLVDRNRESFERGFGAEVSDDWLLSYTDITDKPAIDQLMEEVKGRFGRVDVLINIAGGYSGGKNTYETGEDVWNNMMNMNAKSVFLMSGAVAKLMVENGHGGRIISIGAKPALQGTKNHSAYSASKAAVLRLTESMALEFKDHGINVNAVLPSTMDTAANRASMPNADFSKWVAPESMAGVLGFLASDASRDISGAAIPVYGGSL